MVDRVLLALRLERRTITLAVFRNLHLEHIQVRQLSSNRDAAVRNAEGFIRWALATFEASSVAIDGAETMREGTWRTELRDSFASVLRSEAVALWEEPLDSLLAGFAHPKCRTRQEMRRVALAILPDLISPTDPVSNIDAVALGYHVQTVRELMT